MAQFTFDDLSYIQMLNTMNNRINDALNNSDDQGQNTVMQYFEAPIDEVTFTTLIQSWVRQAQITVNQNETITLTASATPTVQSPSIAVWGDSSTNANWVWGAQTVWG